MVWNAPNVEGDDAPHPRSDSDLVYDAKGSRIFLFGGWANRWFDDLYILDVGSVVGPPYAIMGIKPKTGPITGGQEISVEGLDFVPTSEVLVRFSSRARGGQIEVPGEYVSSTLVKCVSPMFMDIGSGEVEVRVSLNGDSYTTTYQKYSFFAVTDAEKCICFGPGIISGGAPQVETVFVIQAVDATGDFRETGGDEFDIVVRSLTTAGTVPVEITDQEDGKYLVTFTLPDADSEFEISVVFRGTFGGKAGHLRGSPFIVQADNDAGRDKNAMTGPLVMDSIRKEVAELAKFARQTESGLKAKVPEDNLQALLKMKEHIHNATARKAEIDLSFDRSRAVIVYLQGEGASMGRMLDSLQNARNAWQGLQKQVPVTRAAIAPQVKVQAAKTKVDIGLYEEDVAGCVLYCFVVAVCCCLLLFVAVCCCLLLFVAVCCCCGRTLTHSHLLFSFFFPYSLFFLSFFFFPTATTTSFELLDSGSTLRDQKVHVVLLTKRRIFIKRNRRSVIKSNILRTCSNAPFSWRGVKP